MRKSDKMNQPNQSDQNHTDQQEKKVWNYMGTLQQQGADDTALQIADNHEQA